MFIGSVDVKLKTVYLCVDKCDKIPSVSRISCARYFRLVLPASHSCNTHVMRKIVVHIEAGREFSLVTGIG